MEKGFLPNRDNKNCPASQVTIDFIHNVYSGSAFNGCVSLDMRGKHGSFQHIASVECSNLEQYISLMAVYSNCHYYISANSFTKRGRSKDTLFAMHNIVSDIDLHDERLLPLELEEKIENLIWRLQNDCFIHTDIPTPNYIVVTGRGVQLWWCLVPASAKHFSDDVSKISRFFAAGLEGFLDEFPSELGDFRVDTTASFNLAGVYRLPGSINPQCHREVEAIHIHNDRLELKGFWKHCLSSNEIASRIQKNQNPLRFCSRATESFDHIAELRVDAIRQLRDMRCAPAGEETRNDYCFAFFATLSPVIGTAAAYQRTLEFNQGFLQPFTEKELRSTLASALRKDYRFTTRKLVELLNVTDEEAGAVGLQNTVPRLSKAVVKRRKADRNTQIIDLYSRGTTQAEIARQMDLNRQTVSAVVRSSSANKLSRIQSLCQEGRSTSEIAEIIGCSVRTVQRYLKKLPEGVSAEKRETLPKSDKMSKNPYIYGCALGAKAEQGGGAAVPASDALDLPESEDTATPLAMLWPYVPQDRYSELCSLWDNSPENFDGIDTYKPVFSGILTFWENDALAHVANTCPVRIEAAILSCLRDAETRSGDLFIAAKEITDQASRFLNRNTCPKRQQEPLSKSDVLNALDALLQKGLVIQNKAKSGDICYFLWDSYDCEKETARFLADLIAAHPKLMLTPDAIDSAIHQYENSTGLFLSAEQRQAISTVLRSTVSILTGGPGTGKTILLAALCAVIRVLAPGAKMRACAPTGKASVHLAGSIGLPANTIHSLIGSKPHKINCDFLLVDEASMIDFKLFYKLIKSVRKSTHVVFCGDPDQLPCVGGGDVLNAMISSGKIPVATLNQVHRQAEGSGIFRLVHQIKSRDILRLLDIFPPQGEDLIFVKLEEASAIKESVLDTVVSLIAEGTDAADIQVLAATNDWCEALNPQLRTALNPTSATDRTLSGYATGDRVLFLENDYALKLHNGEIGTVLAVSNRYLEIDCGGSVVKYRKRDLQKLSLAYAMTIYKSQGSEYPVVIIPIHKSMGQALTRNLVYTAITRAKKKCVLIGSEKTLLSALRRADSHKSLLSERLANLLP